MATRSDTMETVRLSIAILERIPRNRKVTVRQLHGQLRDAGFERSQRTIKRHADMLASHFDIECDDRSKPYGYRWRREARGLSLAAFGAQEALLLSLARRQLRFLLPSGLEAGLEPFFDQAERSLDPLAIGSPEGASARQWLDKIRVVSEGQPLLPPSIDEGVFKAVSEALYGNRWLDVAYRNAGGQEWRDDVMPLGLVQQGLRFYLVVRVKGFTDERNLALHRMLAARATDMTFERPPGFDLARYEADGRFGFGEGRRIRLHFSISPWAGRHLQETPLSEDQKIRTFDGHLRVYATVVESEMLNRWLNGFGEDVWDVRRRRVNDKEQ